MSNNKRVGNILACGCSYTNGNIYQANIKEFWPELLAKDLGLGCINAGLSGIGNDKIFNETVRILTDKSYNIELVVILWSEMFRISILNNMYSDDRQFSVQTFARNLFKNEVKKAKWVEKFIFNYFSNIEIIDRLCKKYEVKILMGQGLSFESEGSEYFYQKFADAVVTSFKPKYFIGWPIIPQLGGYALQDSDQELAKQENWVSDTDAHPNEKGHRIIANEFLKKYKEVYY